MTDKPKTTLSGKPAEFPEQASAPAGVDPRTNTHKDYWILPEEERAKGFVRPIRQRYIHKVCGAETIMNRLIAETYARDPKYYGETFCSNCREHRPVSEFVWADTDEVVGS